jgi:hypothetical protein
MIALPTSRVNRVVLPFAASYPLRSGRVQYPWQINRPDISPSALVSILLRTTPVPDEGEKYEVLRRLRGIKCEANGRVSVQCMNDFVAEIIIFSTLLIQDIGFKVTWEKDD